MIDALLHAKMIFLSIIFESFPFILLGALFSSLVLVLIPENFFRRWLPGNPWLSLFPAVLLSALFPICECAIIPVIRSLVRKGMPLAAGAVFLVAAPVLNPVVAASTLFAFGLNPDVLVLRLALSAMAALFVGSVICLLRKPLEHGISRELPMDHGHAPKSLKKAQTWHEIARHTTSEFFTVGCYFIFGALIASLFQTFLHQAVLLEIGSEPWSATIVMMILAYLLSLCSAADAFVAASFGAAFTLPSLLAFLVFGPMLDLKNTAMLLGYFPLRFVGVFIATGTLAVFILVMGLHFLGLQ
ncbi:permease [Desulfonatronum parangueonense]